MQKKDYTFSTFNKYTENGIAKSLSENNPERKKPIFICVGSDLVLGDSLGPLVGTMEVSWHIGLHGII